MKGTRQLEYVAFFPMDFPTTEGDVYKFYAIDGYSKFAFSLGQNSTVNKEIIKEQLGLLINHEQFQQYIDKGFTIVFHKYNELIPEFNEFLKPYGGKAIVSDPFVHENFAPFIEHMFGYLKNAK